MSSHVGLACLNILAASCPAGSYFLLITYMTFLKQIGYSNQSLFLTFNCNTMNMLTADTGRHAAQRQCRIIINTFVTSTILQVYYKLPHAVYHCDPGNFLHMLIINWFAIIKTYLVKFDEIWRTNPSWIFRHFLLTGYCNFHSPEGTCGAMYRHKRKVKGRTSESINF